MTIHIAVSENVSLPAIDIIDFEFIRGTPDTMDKLSPKVGIVGTVVMEVVHKLERQ